MNETTTLSHLPYGASAAEITDWVNARKDARKHRNTTDPKLTEIKHVQTERAPISTYKCRGCGKTSSNGGAYGFHVRSCQALDQFDLDLDVTPAPTPAAVELPRPFGPKYQERTDNGSTGDECILCGRHTGGKKNTKFFRVVDGGSRFADHDEVVSEAGDMGYFPVGSECAKVLPAAWAQDGGTFA